MLTKNDIEMALNENSGLTDKHRAQILAGVYREAIGTLREAVVEEEQYLEVYGNDLGPEHADQLRYQITQHNRILDKYPEDKDEE